MSLLTSKNLAGPGYIFLNAMRILNIIGLLAVCTASVVMLIKTFIISRFFFFDACSHVITACIAIFLIISEACLFRRYFQRNWPLLGPQHGFVTLGLAMILLGVNTLGNLNKDATSEKNLGLPFWRIVISSGIIILVLGFLNIVISFIFRDSRLGITARNVRSSGAVAIQDAEAQLESDKTLSIKTSMQSMSINQSPFSPSKSVASSNSPRPTTSPTRTIFQQARASLLPSHYRTSRYSASNYSRSVYYDKETAPPVPPYPTSEAGTAPSMREKVGRHKKTDSKDSKRSSKDKKRESKRSSIGRFPINISSPLNSNPRFAQLVSSVKKPDLAHHPSQRAKSDNPYELPPDF